VLWRMVGTGGLRLGCIWLLLVIVVGGLIGMVWQFVGALF